MRKTKIICTLGPATRNDEMLRKLMLAGMDVARINFSHDSHEIHAKTVARVKRIREELGLPVGLLLDTRGPEIRLGRFAEGGVQLEAGQVFTLTTQDVPGDATRASVSYAGLSEDVRPGSRILIDDGLVALEVQAVQGQNIRCRVLNGGKISDRKGVNVPDVELNMPYLSEQDRADILFGVEHGFDFIAASFVRCADDVVQIRKLLRERDCNNVNIIAKIENRQGVDHLDEIIRVCEGIMVARGDMGVEIPLEEVPVIQKMAIHKVYTAGKVVITATQMLESMMQHPRPTRAEATDVANAIYDGTSAIMLSGETAAGCYPVEAVQTMVKIACRTEQDINYAARFRKRADERETDITNAISHATCTTALDLNAAAIVTVTKSGRTARMISKYRPVSPIVACTTNKSVWRQLNLSWGVAPLLIDEQRSTDELFDSAVSAAEQAGYVHPGELAVLTAGVPLGVSGTTNLIKVHVAGHILLRGQGLCDRKVCARLFVASSAGDVQAGFRPGDILVVRETTNEMMPQLREAAAIIAEAGGMNSHAAIAGLSLDIPVVLGAENATRLLKTGAVVTVDGESGTVSCNECRGK